MISLSHGNVETEIFQNRQPDKSTSSVSKTAAPFSMLRSMRLRQKTRGLCTFLQHEARADGRVDCPRRVPSLSSIFIMLLYPGNGNAFKPLVSFFLNLICRFVFSLMGVQPCKMGLLNYIHGAVDSLLPRVKLVQNCEVGWMTWIASRAIPSRTTTPREKFKLLILFNHFTEWIDTTQSMRLRGGCGS